MLFGKAFRQEPGKVGIAVCSHDLALEVVE
jgi:hypothetical protein